MEEWVHARLAEMKDINFIGNGPASRVSDPGSPNVGLFTNNEDGIRFFTSEGVKKGPPRTAFRVERLPLRSSSIRRVRTARARRMTCRVSGRYMVRRESAC